MEQQYAKALWQILGNGISPKKAVQGLHEALAAQGRALLMPRIAKAFARLAEREMRKNSVILTVAREKDARKALTQAKKIFSEMHVASSEVEVRVDDSLIGGWRLEGRERLADESWKKHLISMYNRATSA